MSADTIDPKALEREGEGTSRRILEGAAESLRLGNVEGLQSRLDQLQELLARYAGGDEDRLINEEVIARAPWLSGPARRVHDQYTQVCGVLAALRTQVRQITDEQRRQNIEKQFDEFAVRLLDFESAQANLLNDAFPNPGWTE